MWIDTKIMLVHCIATAILTRTRFLVMATLIRKLGGLSKDESGIIQILKEHTSEIRKQQKTNIQANKLCTDPIARMSKNMGFGNRTITV